MLKEVRVIFGEGGTPAMQPWRGDQWDYRDFRANGDVTEADLLALLAQVGMEGWELCTTLMIEGRPLLVFKRRRAPAARLTAVGSEPAQEV